MLPAVRAIDRLGSLVAMEQAPGLAGGAYRCPPYLR